MAEYLLAVEIS